MESKFEIGMESKFGIRIGIKLELKFEIWIKLELNWNQIGIKLKLKFEIGIKLKLKLKFEIGIKLKLKLEIGIDGGGVWMFIFVLRRTGNAGMIWRPFEKVASVLTLPLDWAQETFVTP